MGTLLTNRYISFPFYIMKNSVKSTFAFHAVFYIRKLWRAFHAQAHSYSSTSWYSLLPTPIFAAASTV